MEFILRTFLFICYLLIYVALLANETTNTGTVHYPEWTLLFFKIFHWGALFIMIMWWGEWKSGKRMKYFDTNTFGGNVLKAFLPALILFDILEWVYSTFFVLKISLLYMGLNLVANTLLIGPSWYLCYKFAYQRKNLIPPPFK